MPCSSAGSGLQANGAKPLRSSSLFRSAVLTLPASSTKTLSINARLAHRDADLRVEAVIVHIKLLLPGRQRTTSRKTRSEATSIKDKASQTSLRQSPPQSRQNSLEKGSLRGESWRLVHFGHGAARRSRWMVCVLTSTCPAKTPHRLHPARKALGCLAAVALGDPAQVSEGPDLKEHHRSDAGRGRAHPLAPAEWKTKVIVSQQQFLQSTMSVSSATGCVQSAPVQLPDIAVDIRGLTDVIETWPTTAARASAPASPSSPRHLHPFLRTVSGWSSCDARWGLLQLPAHATHERKKWQSDGPKSRETKNREEVAAAEASVTARQTPSMTWRRQPRAPEGPRAKLAGRLAFSSGKLGHIPGPHCHCLLAWHHLLDLGDVHILGSEGS